jgi:hypothetical protein
VHANTAQKTLIVVVEAAFSPYCKPFAEIEVRHHSSELLALDVQSFGDSHVQTAGHGRDDRADGECRVMYPASLSSYPLIAGFGQALF